MTTGRRQARTVAFETLFELESRPGRPLEDVLGRRVSAIEEEEGGMLPSRHREFAGQLVRGTLGEREPIDRLIHQHAPAFPLDQMPLTDRVAIEIGVFELVYGRTASVGVIINEAVELAKTYGGENSGRFVNGVLGTIAEGLSASGHDEPGRSTAHHHSQHHGRR
jgi:N utilization substance protein B